MESSPSFAVAIFVGLLAVASPCGAAEPPVSPEAMAAEVRALVSSGAGALMPDLERAYIADGGLNPYAYPAAPLESIDPLGLCSFRAPFEIVARGYDNITAEDWIRVSGLMQGIGGSFESAFGFGFTFLTSETGIGFAGGVAVGLHGRHCIGAHGLDFPAWHRLALADEIAEEFGWPATLAGFSRKDGFPPEDEARRMAAWQTWLDEEREKWKQERPEKEVSK